MQENADRQNFEYGLFLRNDYVEGYELFEIYLVGCIPYNQKHGLTEVLRIRSCKWLLDCKVEPFFHFHVRIELYFPVIWNLFKSSLHSQVEIFKSCTQ